MRYEENLGWLNRPTSANAGAQTSRKRSGWTVNASAYAYAVVRRAALTVLPVDMLEAEGYLLSTPANLGYLSGAMKHYLGEYPLSKQSAS